MSDWRIPLATDLALRCHAAGMQCGDKIQIRNAIQTLGDQERAFIQKYPDRQREALGYFRAITEYGNNGLSLLVSMAQKYWPVDPPKSSTPSVFVPVTDPAPDPTPPATARKKTAATPPPEFRPVQLQEIRLVFQVHLADAYDGESVYQQLGQHLDQTIPNWGVLIGYTQRKDVIDLRATIKKNVSIVYEKLCGVSYITELKTKPNAMFGNFI